MEHAASRSGTTLRSQTAPQIQTAPKVREPLAIAQSFYCVGSMSCVNVRVLRARSIGVSGGNKLGVRKLVSN
jgi:hypothetical protein